MPSTVSVVPVELFDLDEPCGQVGAKMRPGLQLALVAGADMVDHVGRGDEPCVGERVGDDLGAEVEVRVAGADDDGAQRLARVEDGGRDTVAVGAGERGVDDEGLGVPGHEDARLVERRRRAVEDRVGQCGHGVLGRAGG